MNTEELKAGERYNFTLLYTGQSINNKFRFESPIGIHYILGLGDMEAVSPVSAPENGKRNTEPSLKYDPCRKFREGDIVEPCQVNGRWSSPVWENRSGIHYEVTKDEDPLTTHMDVKDPDSPHPFLVHAAFFKLVTPVEELKPYSVVELSNGDYAVYKGDERLCVFRDGKLVTPVEELEPYSVHETNYLYRVMQSVDGGEQVVCEYRKNTHPHAKERAEAERDGLNAEYRKEQK